MHLPLMIEPLNYSEFTYPETQFKTRIFDFAVAKKK